MTSDFPTRDEVKLMIGEAKTEILEILKDMAGSTTGFKAFHDAANEEPAMAPKYSRKFTGFKDDVRARIDRTLFKLLIADAKAQSGGNVSRQLDIILWRYYGKPKLSFEENDNA
jgi:hypothetical protein